MALTEKKIKVMMRWMHIVLGLIIMCYIYSPFHENPTFQFIMKFVIIPVITITGLWMWKFKAFNKFFKIKSS